MHCFILIISVLAGLVSCGLLNAYCKQQVITNVDIFEIGTLTSLSSATTLAIIAGKLTVPSTFTILVGLVFGLATYLYGIFIKYAYKTGPLTYTTLLVSLQLLIPTFCGSYFWDEPINNWQILGILLLFISFWFCLNPKKDKQITFSWAIMCVIAALFSGVAGVLQKIHQTSDHANELSELLITVFLISALFSLVSTSYYKIVKNEKRTFSYASKWTWIMILVGVCGAAQNQINLHLSGVMPSIVFFPIVNGLGLLLTALVARVFFNEKLSKKQILSLCIGTISILFIGNMVTYLLHI